MFSKAITLLILILLPFRILANDIDTQHILLKVKFSWEKRNVSGIAEITFTPTKSTKTIILDAGNLTINSIFHQKEKLKFKYDGGDANNNLEIELNRIYNTGELITIQIDYRSNHENKSDPNAIWGSFGKGLRFQQPTSTTPKKRKQIWSSGEPDGNKYWFPCNEDIADIHTTEIITTVEKSLWVISNGELVENKVTDDKNHSFHYKSKNAFPNYLVSIVIGEYKDIIQKNNNHLIHTFGYADESDAVKATTELLPDMMQFMEEKTGYQYPYQSYSQVVVQDYPFPGLNSQHNASIISDNYIDDYGVHKVFKYLWDGVALQALAGQWFGNLLMPKSWGDIWLNNAFNQYFAGLYSEKCNSRTEYLTYIQPFEKSNVLADWSAGNIHPVSTNNFKDKSAFINDSYSKYKGALILHLLQKEAGDDVWWKAVRLYIKTFANKQVSTSDFQNIVEITSGKSYQWFFDQWIYKTGSPMFEITKSFDNITKQLTVNVKQKQRDKPNDDYEYNQYFEGKIGIEIDERIETVSLAPKEITSFNFTLDNEPGFINFNYESIWLCEIEFIKSKEEYIQQLLHSKDVLARQEAIDHLITMVNDSTISIALKDRIISLLISEISSNQYWRYRLYVLNSLRKSLQLHYSDTITSLLKQLIKKESGWIKTSAITALGNTNDPIFLNIYKEALTDESDRVINAACIAIGKTKSEEAYSLLMNMENKTSWKKQNRISALNGLEQLGDARAVDYALECLMDNTSPRWYLATPIWDYPFAAVNTLIALGKENLAYSIFYIRFLQSMEEHDINDLFQNVMLINQLKLEQAKEIYPLLKNKFKNDKYVLDAINNYEVQLLEGIKQ